MYWIILGDHRRVLACQSRVTIDYPVPLDGVYLERDQVPRAQAATLCHFNREPWLRSLGEHCKRLQSRLQCRRGVEENK